MLRTFGKFFLATAILFTACKKSETNTTTPLAPAKGIYVLSEGNFGSNNTKLGYYNIATGTFTGDYFNTQNPGASGLGDTGNDMVLYGGKLYIVMNGSSQVIVLNASNGQLVNRIPFVTGSNPKSPRYAIGYRGKVYVTAYDNTVSIIDTSSLSITGSIATGANPDGIAAYGDYLYVANSGSYNYPDVDSTVSVLSLNSLSEIKKIVVGKNPNKVEVAANGDVYVSCYGNFGSIPASVSVINSSTNLLKTNLSSAYAYSHVRTFGNLAYFYNNYAGTGAELVYNTATNSNVRTEFITDGTALTATYGINIDEENGDVYLMDAKNFSSAGEVFCFNSAGVKKFSFSVSPGVNPNKVVFNR